MTLLRWFNLHDDSGLVAACPNGDLWGPDPRTAAQSPKE